MTDPDHLKILKKLQQIENLLVLLIRNKQTNAVGSSAELEAVEEVICPAPLCKHHGP